MEPVQPDSSDVKEFAEEFSLLPSSKIDLMLEYADSFLNPVKWGRKYKLAKILMTCHLLKLNSLEASGKSGIVTSESLGDQSISIAAPDANEMLNLSGYGQQYLALRKTLGITPLVL